MAGSISYFMSCPRIKERDLKVCNLPNGVYLVTMITIIGIKDLVEHVDFKDSLTDVNLENEKLS